MSDPTLRLRRDGLDWRAVDGEIVVLDSTESVYLSLNGSGAVLWAALANGATRNELLERLRSEFDVGREVAEHDLDQFLTDMRERRLLIE